MILVVDNYDSFTYNLVQLLQQLGADVEVRRNDRITPDELDELRPRGIVVSPGPSHPDRAGHSAALIRRALQLDAEGGDGATKAAHAASLEAPRESPRPQAPSPKPAAAAAAAAEGRPTPVLGVCLGHQVIARVFGAEVRRAPSPVHGKPAAVEHDGLGVFVNVPAPARVARYHSLAIVESTLPADLRVTARAEDGVIMGVRHQRLPVEGVQFHPESILTGDGATMLSNFLNTTEAMR